MININQDNKALNEQGEAENILDTTPVAKEEASVEATEPTEPVSPAGETVPEATAEETEESKKKGYSQRVRELVAEKNEYKQKYVSLADQMAKLTGSTQPDMGTQPAVQVADEPIIRPGEEIDGTELDKRLKTREASTLQKAIAAAQLISKQGEAVNRINSESREAVMAYPELDPESDTFNKELSDIVTEAVEEHAKTDPFNASVKKKVASLMKLYKGVVAKEVGQATENIAKQVSETALRPTSIRKAEKPASEKSIAELEADLGIVQA